MAAAIRACRSWLKSVSCPLLRDRSRVRRVGKWRRLDFEVYAYDLVWGPLSSKDGALAKLGELQVRRPAEFNPGGDENAVNLQARSPLELEEEIDQSGIAGASAQHPPAASEDCAGDSLH